MGRDRGADAAAPDLIRGINKAAWDLPGDLMLLGILLAGVGAAYELAARVSGHSAYLPTSGIALAAAVLQIWINLAAGIIGTEDNPANWIYVAVVAVAGAGAVLARSQPSGMARAMIATAIAQAAAFVVALSAGLGFTGPITVFFAALWLISAALFRRAAREQLPRPHDLTAK